MKSSLNWFVGFATAIGLSAGTSLAALAQQNPQSGSPSGSQQQTSPLNNPAPDGRTRMQDPRFPSPDAPSVNTPGNAPQAPGQPREADLLERRANPNDRNLDQPSDLERNAPPANKLPSTSPYNAPDAGRDRTNNQNSGSSNSNEPNQNAPARSQPGRNP